MKRYDAYEDMLATHREIGYLLVIVVALIFFDVASVICYACWPTSNVYLVPGVDHYGVADVAWGVDPPSLSESQRELAEQPTAAAAETLDAIALPLPGDAGGGPVPTKTSHAAETHR